MASVEQAVDDATKSVNAAKLMEEMRRAFRSGVTRDVRWREDQLHRLSLMLKEREQEIYDAIEKDLARGPFDSFSEVIWTKRAADDAARNVKSWARPTKVSTDLINFPATSETLPEPYGVALIIVPWNFPFMLALEPLIGAIAAGNAAVVKPSELAPHCSALLAKLFDQYLDSTALRLVQGGPEVAASLLEQKWDKIFFTGGTEVGRKVALAAAKNLTPVTLELGGKNPCYLDSSADLSVVSRRLAWGMCYNAGQACLKPEYLMVEEDVAPKLIASLKKALLELYGQDPSKSPDLARIISTRHLDRLSALLADAAVAERILVGGQIDKETRFVAPTLLHDVPWDCVLMEQETFGPILAVQTVKSLEEAISVINERPKPLAIYVFSTQRHVVDKLEAETSSGALVVNETIAHVLNPSLPFGGVGESGSGAYHGKASFECFSHRKAIMRKGTFGDVPFRYPPSDKHKNALMRALFQLDLLTLLLLLLGLKR